MKGSNIGSEEIFGILSEYVKKGDERARTVERSRVEVIESVVDEIARAYDAYSGLDTARSADSAYKREDSYNFLEASGPLIMSNEGLTPVEKRIKSSDLLALHYALVGGGIDTMMDSYIGKLTPGERAALAEDTDKLIQIGAEVAAKFVVRQRERNKENELAEKFPEAPTTGFEFEYIDPIRALVDEVNRAPRRIEMLKLLKDKDLNGVENLLVDKSDERYINGVYIDALKAEVKESEDAGAYSDYIDSILNYRVRRLEKLKEFMKSPQDIKVESTPETGIRYGLQEHNKTRLEKDINSIRKLLNTLGLSSELEDTYSEEVKRQLDLILGKLEIAEGADLNTKELIAMRMLVPSQSARLSILGTHSTKDELYSAEEAITSPSISVRMQLRDFVYAAKLGAFHERLTVHQTVGGVELTPDRTEYMEVTALLEGAGFNNPESTIPEGLIELIEDGKSAYNDPYKKISEGTDGKKYYYPYHRVKHHSGVVTYPNKPRSLVEMRSKRAFDTETGFITHVRASTFTWLSAWGEQAANIAEAQRTSEQQDLSQAWNELMQEWRKVLDMKEIEQPQGPDRYQEVEGDLTSLEYKGEEKYSLYVEQIAAKNIREDQQGISEDPDSLRSQSRRLIREYNRKVKDIIGY